SPTPGICCDGTTTPSRTLPELVGASRRLPKYAKPRVQIRNTAARTPVDRDRKLAPPEAPKRLADPAPPPPKAAPASAPLPCCIRINPIMTSADKICTVKRMVNTTFIFNSRNCAPPTEAQGIRALACGRCNTQK